MENNSSVIGRLSFLASVVGDGAVAGIQQMARGTGAAMTKLASSVPAAAFASSAAAVAGIGAALVGGTIAAAQFEDAFANVRKVLARASEEELTAIRDAVLDLSTEIPVAAGQLAQLGSIAGQLGVGVSDIPQFIDTVAKLGVATNMSAEQAAFSIARLANVTGIGAENADQLGNVLVRLGNNTAATEFFEKTTTSDLQKLINPIIEDSMKENQVAKYYETVNDFYKSNVESYTKNSSVMEYASKLGVDSYIPKSSDEDLNGFVTQKAISGLFKMIAEKESAIRENPIEQTTSLLKEVFTK